MGSTGGGYEAPPWLLPTSSNDRDVDVTFTEVVGLGIACRLTSSSLIRAWHGATDLCVMLAAN